MICIMVKLYNILGLAFRYHTFNWGKIFYILIITLVLTILKSSSKNVMNLDSIEELPLTSRYEPVLNKYVKL